MHSLIRHFCYRSSLNHVSCVSASQRALQTIMLVCQCGLRTNVLSYQRAKRVPTLHFYLPTCHQTCQPAIRCTNVPKILPIFQAFFLRNAKGNFYTLSLYKKFYIILDIVVIICICIAHKNCLIININCIILHVYILPQRKVRGIYGSYDYVFFMFLSSVVPTVVL